MVQHVSRVDPNGTSLEFVCGLDRPVDVLREDGSSKTVDGVVGLTEDILVILELDDDTDGTEDLFLQGDEVRTCVKDTLNSSWVSLGHNTAAPSRPRSVDLQLWIPFP